MNCLFLKIAFLFIDNLSYIDCSFVLKMSSTFSSPSKKRTLNTSRKKEPCKRARNDTGLTRDNFVEEMSVDEMDEIDEIETCQEEDDENEMIESEEEGEEEGEQAVGIVEVEAEPEDDSKDGDPSSGAISRVRQ